MLFELPIVDERILPFRNELSLELLRELHHVVDTAGKERGRDEGRVASLRIELRNCINRKKGVVCGVFYALNSKCSNLFEIYAKC